MTGTQGWHPDPGGTGGFRYWDGERWGDVRGAPQEPVAAGGPVAPSAPPPPYQVASPSDPAAVAMRGRWAQVGLVVALPAQALGAVAGGVALRASVDAFRVFFKAVQDNPDAPAPRIQVTPNPAAAGISQLSSLAMLVVGVLFLVWFHSAATQARALGLPARRSPGWGVAGFLIPVVNLWFPYGSVKDLFPPGDARSKVVGRWFFTWLGSGVALFVAQVVLAVSTPAGLVAVLAAVALLGWAVLSARRLIAAVGEAHAEVVGARTGR